MALTTRLVEELIHPLLKGRHPFVLRDTQADNAKGLLVGLLVLVLGLGSKHYA
jgi:hypothetical protein